MYEKGKVQKPKIPEKLNAAPALPKRFYSCVQVFALEASFTILLDGKTVKTPARKEVLLPQERLATLVAQEFSAQKDVIDPKTMPVTRLVNTVIDGVIDNKDAVLEDLLRFCASDYLCYRASTPKELVLQQEAVWDPILDWVGSSFGAWFKVTEGITYIPQPKEAIAAIKYALRGVECPFKLGALHMMTASMGSLFLALAVYKGQLTPKQAWEAAHLEEQWVEEQWGQDKEQKQKRAYEFLELQAAASVLNA